MEIPATTLPRVAGHLAIFALVLGAGLLACSPPEVYEGNGVIEGIDRGARQVTLAHEDIAGLMPAMTMNFDVAHPALLDPLEPGQVVRFKLARRKHAYTIVEIRAEGSSLAPVAEGRTRALAEGRAPNFTLIDQDGDSFSLESLRGHVLVLDFIYTRCPGPCPALTGLHVDVQRALPASLQKTTRFVSISIDPQNDTPEALRAYAAARGIDLSGWTLATGEPAQIEKVLRDYAVGSMPRAEGDDDGSPIVEHQIVTYLINAQGAIAGHYWGSGQSVGEWLAAIAQATPGGGA